MRDILRKHHISFKNALHGIIWSCNTQPNFRVHLVFTCLVLFFAWFFQVSKIEFLILLFTIILGLCGEMINTSIEAVTDLVTKEWRVEAKIAKDVSAGMMLLIAIGAVIIGLSIFLPHVISYFNL